jgi:predicted acyltransferase
MLLLFPLQVSNERWATMLRASVVYTDSFLFLSGVLTSFNMSKEIKRKKRVDWVKKHAARFIR